MRSGWITGLAWLGLLASVAAAGEISPPLGLGRTPTAQEIQAWDIAIGPDGKELPPGQGTAQQGAGVYLERCAACHGETGVEGPQDVLVGGQGSLATDEPLRTIGSYWPYATTVYDYIFRSMPFYEPGSLSPDEVYALTAYLLHLNGIIDENVVINADTLPKVRMPNRTGFVAALGPGTALPLAIQTVQENAQHTE